MIEQWRQSDTDTAQRWLDVFEHFRSQEIEYDAVLQLVQFALALPGTNAPIERVFFLMNNIWSDAKTQLTTETLRSMLIATVNTDKPCLDFYKEIKGNKQLLTSIHSTEKYKWKRNDRDLRISRLRSNRISN